MDSSPDNPAVPAKALRAAAALIKRGEVVAFPTETIYGLGANALDPAAVAKVFRLKGRPADNPLIVHVSSKAMLKRLVKRIPPAAQRLMDRFWPGPLTVVLEKTAKVPDITTGGRNDVGVRMPDHPIALNLISAAGVPIAAPSANKSGRPSPTTAAHVRQDFPRLPIIDGGQTLHGVESTVVSFVGKPTILRLGAISVEQIREVVPGVLVHVRADENQAPASPGQKYRHYAPSVPLHLFRSTTALRNAARKERAAIVLCREQDRAALGDLHPVSLGSTPEEIAHNLYAALRKPKRGKIFVLAMPKRGLSRTVMDRLERASTRIY